MHFGPLTSAVVPWLQARWMDDNALTTLPNIDTQAAQQLAAKGLQSLPQLLHSLQPQQQPQQQARKGGTQVLSRDQVSSMLASVLGGTAKAAEVLTVADRLPVLNVSWQPHKTQPAAAPQPGAEQNGLGGDGGEAGSSSSKWVLDVYLQRQRPSGGRAGSSSGGVAPRVYAPHFPKVKEEGWWVVVGHRESLELLAMKRVSFGGKSSVKLSFPAFSASGAELHTATLFCISDCYLGLDQQYDVILDPAAAARDDRAAAARAGWLGGSSGSDSSAAAAAAAGGGSSDAAAARRARRQQQLAARQQHQAADGEGQEDGQWEDEPSCA
jgi:activating signal cointegrator complex subunit 3